MPIIQDELTGKFIRTLSPWSPDNWDNGFLNNKGRFLVYKPSSKYKLNIAGYALRYYIVWELYSSIPILKGYVLHHINGNKTDDRFENLELMTKKLHDAYHKELMIKNITRTCETCKQDFYIKPWRLNQTGCNRGTFCSQICYYKAGGRWYKHRKSDQ